MKVVLEFDTQDGESVIHAYEIISGLSHFLFRSKRKGGENVDTTMEDLKVKVKEYRVKIDAVRLIVAGLKKTPVNIVAERNIQLSIEHLEDAKMRLGKVLEDMGSELPAEFADKAK